MPLKRKDIRPHLTLERDIVVNPNGFKVFLVGEATLTTVMDCGREVASAKYDDGVTHKGGEDRLQLWAHLVAMHAACVPTDLSLSQLREMHSWEHNGPGGIRNHDEALRTSSLHRIGKVLFEVEPEDE